MKGKIKLTCGDQAQYFPFAQAQGLLYIQKEMNRISLTGKREGWELPDDSPYEFKDNGLIKRGNTKNSKKSSKSAGDPTGETSPK